MSDTLHDQRHLPILLDIAAIDDPRLSVYDIGVYIIILRFAAGKGTAFPSLRTMSDRLNIARSTVQKSITHLCKLGYIHKENRTLPNGGQTSNHYTIMGVPSDGTGGYRHTVWGEGVPSHGIPNNPDLPVSNSEIKGGVPSHGNESVVVVDSIDSLELKEQQQHLIDNHGITPSVAAELVRRFSPKRIQEVLTSQNVAAAKNKPGYIVKALRGNWSVQQPEPEAQKEPDWKRYTTGKYAEWINH